jgi:hypothetical protein
MNLLVFVALSFADRYLHEFIGFVALSFADRYLHEFIGSHSTFICRSIPELIYWFS